MAGFGSRSWTIIASDGKKYDQVSCTGPESGVVRVASRRVVAYFGVHHCIVLEAAKSYRDVPLYLVYEWMGDGYHSYATDKITANWCETFGTATADQVSEAAEKASSNDDGSYRTYNMFTSNCNHWTWRAAKNLGHEANVFWNCPCVLPEFVKRNPRLLSLISYEQPYFVLRYYRQMKELVGRR